MDPDEALKSALDAATAILNDPTAEEGLGVFLAESFLALHERLTTGGGGPEAWENEKDRNLRTAQKVAAFRSEEIRTLEGRDRGKFYVKARVYGAIAAEYQKALQAFADRGEALAKAALDWRHSESGGVPMSSVEAMGELLDASRLAEKAKASLVEAEKAGEIRQDVLEGALASRDEWVEKAHGVLAEAARLKVEVERLKMELSGEGQVIAELKERIESGRAAHNEERVARDWLAREKERLETVIKTGGAAYRLERAKLGIAGGIDEEGQPILPADIRTLAEEVEKGQSRSLVGAAQTFARFLLGK